MKSNRRLSLSVLSAFVVAFQGCVTLFGPGVPTDPVEKLQYDIDRVLADSIFQSTVPSIKVVAPISGQVLYERNSHQLIRPASNMKLVTSAAGLHVLGPNYLFKTGVAIDSLMADGTVKGNVFIKGYGNPDLVTADLDTLASRLAALGVRRVTGGVIADPSFLDSLLWGTGWMWADEPAPYQAYVSGLSLNKNCVEVSVVPDSVSGSVSVAIKPETKYVRVDNRATVAKDSVTKRLSISRPPTEPPNTIVIEGELKATGGAYQEQITILDPAMYAATVFSEALARAGIVVAGNSSEGRLPSGVVERVWHTRGIDSMVINLNKVSDNLSAEMTLKTIAAVSGSPPGSARHGAWAVNRFLKSMGIDTTNHWMVDGSGLSHYNLLRVDFLVDLLSRMYERADLFPLYYTSLPVAGVDGTLRASMKATRAEGNVHAKTGSIAGVSSLSGYVTTLDGEMLVFGMTMQDFILPSRYFRAAQDKICALLAEFRRGR